ncbi:MAG: hypothetical protein LQ349_001218 [Xanthoria aureola]|nr:MAG: hypothetical protein LQ349_001218 [Xanthoria aureola]
MLASFLMLLPVSVLPAQLAHAALLPTTPTSGNFQEMDSPCQQYSLCGSKGLQYWRDLIATLASPFPADKDDDFHIYKDWYHCTLEDRAGAGQEVEHDLTGRGLSSIDDYKMWHVSSLHSKNGNADRETSYENLFNTHDGVIIATYNWRPLDSQKKLQWSDIVYHTYRLNLEAGQSMQSLQAVIQADITNPGTFRILQSAYKARGLDATYDRKWRRWTLADYPFFFWFLGTDNVKGTLFLLKDHASAVGRKLITEIWTRADPSVDIWIKLGPYSPSTGQIATT